MSTKQRLLWGGRQRRTHSEEFKAHVVEACGQPGVSMAAVALANGLNANLLRRWVVARGGVRPAKRSGPEIPLPASRGEFVPLQLAAPSPRGVDGRQIQIELHRGTTTVKVSWPLEAAEACAAWLRSWLA